MQNSGVHGCVDMRMAFSQPVQTSWLTLISSNQIAVSSSEIWHDSMVQRPEQYSNWSTPQKSGVHLCQRGFAIPNCDLFSFNGKTKRSYPQNIYNDILTYASAASSMALIRLYPSDPCIRLLCVMIAAEGKHLRMENREFYSVRLLVSNYRVNNHALFVNRSNNNLLVRFDASPHCSRKKI